MKKLLLIAALMGFGVAHADYLYWMVGDNPTETVSGDSVYWDSAAFFQGDEQLGDPMTTEDFDLFDYGLAELNDGYETSSFLIELYMGGAKVAYLPLAYDNIKDYIYREGANPPPLPGLTVDNVYSPAAEEDTQFIPEPTSGLLFLLGGMLLGLKRRRPV